MQQKESFRGFDPEHPLANAKRLLIFGVVVIGCLYLYLHGKQGEVSRVIARLAGLAPGWLLVMLLLETAYLVFQGGILRGAYRLLGFTRGWWYGMLMYLAMNLVNTIAPVAGISGSIYMGYLERRQGVKRGEVVLVNFLYYATDYLVFLLVMLGCLAILAANGGISHPVKVAAQTFTVFVSVLLIGGGLLLSHRSWYEWLVWLVRSALRLVAPKRADGVAEAMREFFVELQESWVAIRGRGREVLMPMLSALGLHIVSLAMLWAAFSAFGVPVNLEQVLAGYVVATLFMIVSPTPAGIGVAEGVLTAVFIVLGVSSESALLVALAYRGVFVWYPLILGVLVVNWLPPSTALVSKGGEPA